MRSEDVNILSSWAQQEMSMWNWRKANGQRFFVPDHLFERAGLFSISLKDGQASLGHQPSDRGVLHARANLYLQLITDAIHGKGLPDCTIYIDVNDESLGCTEFPIFSFQRSIGSPLLLLPDIDFLHSNFYLASEFNDPIQFAEKLDSAIFVGSTTGAGLIDSLKLKNDSVPRIRLARFSRHHKEIIVRLPNLVQCTDEAVEMLQKEGWGGPNIQWRDQLLHKFQISIDGNGATCSRVYLALISNSILLKYRSANELFYFRGIQDGVHYYNVALENDIKDIMHLDTSRLISVSESGQEFARRLLCRKACLFFSSELMFEYTNWLNR